MYKRRGGNVRADVGKLNAEQVTGVAVGSGNYGGKHHTQESAPPPSDSLTPTRQMRRPSTPGTGATEESEEKERTKKQLESITGRMFQVLNDFEDDEDSYTQSYRLERKQVQTSTRSRSHNREMMQSNIDGMMANYDQISAEREELLESLADWFQQSHTDAGVNITSSLSHVLPAMTSRARAVSERLKDVEREITEKTASGTPPHELQQERKELEAELAASLPTQHNVTRDAIAMSWKYAATEIYSLLSDVRDTDAEEMNTLEQRITELVASLAQQAQVIEKLSTELQHQKELVYFSDKTTQGLAADNSDLREQLERVRGQLVEARNATKTTTMAAATSKGNEEERGKREDNSNDSSENGKTEVYRAQIKDLNKRLAQLQEENKMLQHKRQSSVKENEMTHCSEAAVDTTPTHHSDHALLSSDEPKSHINTPNDSVKATNDDTREELCALREQLQIVMDEKAALETEFQRRMKEEGGEERGKSQNTQCRSQHTQTVNIETRVSPPQHSTVSHTPHPTPTSTHSTQHTTHPTLTPRHTARPKPPKTRPMPTPTKTSIAPNTEPSGASTIAMTTVSETKLPALPVATSMSHVESTTPSIPTVAMDTVANTVPRINVETVGVNTIDKGTKTGDTSILELMENMINKVITNQSDFFTADSSTLHRIHGNLQNVCDVILSFLHHSMQPVAGGGSGEGADVMRTASEALTNQLPENSDLVLNQSQQILPNRVKTRRSRREGGSEKPDQTRDEIKEFTSRTIQRNKTESAMTSAVHYQQDKPQMVFEAIQNHRQRSSQGETVTYPLPPWPLIHPSPHEVAIHRVSSRPEQESNLGPSVSVMGVASAHSIHDNIHPRVKISAHHKAQLNALLFPWRHPFHSNTHNSHLHASPPSSSSLLPSPFNFPLTGVHVGGGPREGLEEEGGKRGRKGTRGRRKKRQSHNSETSHSNFLQVNNNMLSAPPRTAPSQLKGVANSLGNHHHGNQMTHTVRDREEEPSNNDARATFIDLLMQSPLVSKRFGTRRRSNRTGSVGGGSLKLPTIQ